jgi:hydrogenase/urease accessory protein HupE
VNRAAIFTLACVLLGVVEGAHGHESRPAVLDLRELPGKRYEMVWRNPTLYGKRLPVALQVPADWQHAVDPAERVLPAEVVERRVVLPGPAGIDGAVLRFPGLETTITDVYVRTTRADGTTATVIARPAQPWVELRGERPWYATSLEYLRLGFHHILLGVDHLLFVLGLLLIVRSRMLLLKTITSFTVAHSITLAAATLSFASVPLPPLNAAVALSILFLGPEIVRSWRGETSLTIRYPWLVAFAFGLLHGFGFASGLSTTGMPRAELPLALLFFNVGVELGQLTFVFLALALARSFRVLKIRWPRWATAIPGYTVGSLGAYWTIQRTLVLFGVVV